MNLVKSTGTFGFYTIISRLLGYLRDVLIAIFLGTSILADVFFVAFRIPNTFRRLFAEGTFNAAFVPSYSSELLKSKSKSQIFANEKISIQEVKESLFEMTKLKFSEFAPKNQEMMRTPRLGDLGILTPDSDVPMTKNADGFLICVAGGASLHSAFMPSFGGSTPVSHAVELGA